MKKKGKSLALEPLLDFMIDCLEIPPSKEIDRFIKKIEQSLLRSKVPTKADFNRLVKRVESLEKRFEAEKGARRDGTAAETERQVVVATKRPASRAKQPLTDSQRLLQVMRKYRTGADVAKLKAVTGFEDKKIRNILFRLSKKDEIKRVGRGIYKAVP